jgi:hypothetical protein
LFLSSFNTDYIQLKKNLQVPKMTLFADPADYKKYINARLGLHQDLIDTRENIRAYINERISKEQFDALQAEKQQKPTTDSIKELQKSLKPVADAFEIPKDKDGKPIKMERNVLTLMNSFQNGLKEVKEELQNINQLDFNSLPLPDIEAKIGDLSESIDTMSKAIETNKQPNIIGELQRQTATVVDQMQKIQEVLESDRINEPNMAAELFEKFADLTDKLDEVREKQKDRKDQVDLREVRNIFRVAEIKGVTSGWKAQDVQQFNTAVRSMKAIAEKMTEMAANPTVDVPDLEIDAAVEAVKTLQAIRNNPTLRTDDNFNLVINIASTLESALFGKERQDEKDVVPDADDDDTPQDFTAKKPARPQSTKKSRAAAAKQTGRSKPGDESFVDDQKSKKSPKKSSPKKKKGKGITPDDFLEMQKMKNESNKEYNPPTRNGMVHDFIHDGYFHNLYVEVPKMEKDGKLVVRRRGPKSPVVMNRVIDQDTVDLLTRKYSPRRKYSDRAWEIYERLINLSSFKTHPNIRRSGKFKALKKRKNSNMKGNGVVVKMYNNDKELKDRLKLLQGSKKSGNNNPAIDQEISEIQAILNKAKTTRQ